MRQKFSLERKKNEQIKGLICNMWMFFFGYTIQLITIKLCIGVTKGKIENLKREGKMRISILIFIYTIHFAYLKVYTKFENAGSNRS